MVGLEPWTFNFSIPIITSLLAQISLVIQPTDNVILYS